MLVRHSVVLTDAAFVPERQGATGKATRADGRVSIPTRCPRMLLESQTQEYAALRDVRYSHSVCTDTTKAALCDRLSYKLSGTDSVYSALVITLRAHYAMSGSAAYYAMSGTDLAYDATREVQVLAQEQCIVAVSLRPCYAIFGTGIAYAAISPRLCYAISSTDLASAYAHATQCPY
eukprot:3381481-Rhodomonas_salina.2